MTKKPSIKSSIFNKITNKPELKSKSEKQFYFRCISALIGQGSHIPAYISMIFNSRIDKNIINQDRIDYENSLYEKDN